ncbi:MAG: hypothetical protein IJQ50_07025, partial [Clostridia bacterium]|nr:hypothetical protein [Clostridia bacterium]
NSGLENWSAKNNISSITTTAGSLKATLSGAEPCIGIDGINIPIREVKYIKLRLKNLTSGNKGRLIFKTADAGYSDFTSIDFNIMSSGADYQDIYIPVHSNSLWTGTLTGLKIMPCLSGNALLSGSDKNEFYIDEISLIDGNGSETLHGATILFNGAPIDATNDLIVEDDIPYISASKVQNLLNMIYSYDAETETATFVRGNTKMSMQIDDNKIYYNDSSASFTGGAIMVDGKVYVHYNVFTLFNYIVAYDSAKQMLILRNPWYGNGYDDIIANNYTLTNITSFGTFEGASPLSNISVNSNVFAQVMSSGAYAGSKALKMVASQANAYSGISVTVKPDTYYCFSAYAKVTSGSTDLTLRSDNLKNTADNHDYVSRTLTGEYTKVSAVFKPIITNEQTIELQFGTSAASTVYIDNIEFYEMPVVYDNAVIGGTFENGGDIDGVVSAYGSTVKEVTTEKPIYNNKSLHVTTTGTNGGVAMRAYVIPGERYYLRATVRLIDSTANQVSFALRMHTDSSNWSGGDVVVRKVESVGKAVTLQGYYNAPKVSNNTSYISVAPWEESEYLVDNIEVLHVRNESPEGMVVGELSFYKDYGTASEVKAKNTYLSSGRWTAVLKNFENLAETNQDIAVIMALYKGDELRKIVPIRRNIDEYSYIKEPITASIDVPDLSDGDYYVKGFVFENFSTLTSLVRSITVTE